jgi:hypothetical protein
MKHHLYWGKYQPGVLATSLYRCQGGIAEVVIRWFAQHCCYPKQAADPSTDSVGRFHS